MRRQIVMENINHIVIVNQVIFINSAEFRTCEVEFFNEIKSSDNNSIVIKFNCYLILFPIVCIDEEI